MTYAEIAEILGKHPRSAVATVVKIEGSAPREAGARMIVLPGGRTEGTVGGGILEKRVIEDALNLLEKGGTLLKYYSLMPEKHGGIGAECGGESLVFIESFGLGPRIVICGGGHIGLELYKLALQLGWQAVVADDRPEYSGKDRFPLAVETRTLAYSDPALRQLMTMQSAVVIVTHAHAADAEALANAVQSEAFYIGMIGSSRKVASVFAALRKQGVEDEALAAVRAPIGLNIGAETPPEIALSIFSEILAAKAGISSPGTMKEEKAGGREA